MRKPSIQLAQYDKFPQLNILQFTSIAHTRANTEFCGKLALQFPINKKSLFTFCPIEIHKQFHCRQDPTKNKPPPYLCKRIIYFEIRNKFTIFNLFD